jgi:nucleoside-diphosphate-sugar epimerase
MNKVLITGSSGLIGRWVIEQLLANEVQVVGLDTRPAAKPEWEAFHHRVDILDAEAIERIFQEEKPTMLIHLAARCDLDGNTLADYEANRQGVRNVCTAVRKCGSVQRAIYTSSQLVCGVGHIPKNDLDFCPSTPYGESKVCTEQIVREENGGDTEWIITRPTTVWGPYVNEHYQGLLRHIRRGTYFHSGSGELLKSYSFAGNIAHQYVMMLSAPNELVHEKVFFLADYEPFSLRRYCDSLAEELGARPIRTVPLPIARLLGLVGDGFNAVGWKKFPYNSFRLKNIRTEYVFDLSETEKVCGDLPFDFETGVKLTARWYLDSVEKT